MISEIKYNGFTASPSDYDCVDGDLALAVNMIPEDGALRPIPAPEVVFTLSEGQKVILLHETNAYSHYIIKDSANNLYWRTKDGNNLTPIADFAGGNITTITAIGNTIVALCEDGMHYILWETSSYKYLGSKIPECPISFGLQGTPVMSEEFEITKSGVFQLSIAGLLIDVNDRQSVTEQLLAEVNKFVADNSTNAGRFLFPFFVRYAYRLYDGSLTYHSAPILMLPTTNVNPMVRTTASYIDQRMMSKIFAVSADLDYQALLTETAKESLKSWGDIVKSVDIFISAPIYTYDQSGTVFRLPFFKAENYFYGKYSLQSDYKIQDLNDLFDQVGENMPNIIELPFKPIEGIDSGFLPSSTIAGLYSDIADCGQFYFLKSIEIDKLALTRTKIPIAENYLQALVNREVMTDDYQTHDTLIPSFAQVYNSRLNIANVKRKMYEGYDMASMVGYINYTDENTPLDEVYAVTTLSTPEGVFEVQNKCSIPLSNDPRVFSYVFYPDTMATKMNINPNGFGRENITDENGLIFMKEKRKDVALKEHTHLNGSVFFNGFGGSNEWVYEDWYFPVEKGAILSASNKIYTSEVNNPFYFPLVNINTIGTGGIIGISTAAKALSEGQFGQFPLYAFTTDGVWALEVSNTGSYIAKQPITRDVCVDGKSITQIDDAVLFATARGIMLLSGSQSLCITDALDSNEYFSLLNLPNGIKLTELSSLYTDAVAPTNFKMYIEGCKISYDYVNQRVFVFNPNYRYAYVFSLDTKAWGMVESDLTDTINSYPEPLAMNRFNSLVNLTNANKVVDIPCLAVTRPLKLDTRDLLKTVDSIIQRGMFKKGDVKVALFGSRDLRSWQMVASSTDHYLRGFSGTPYKFFRIVIIGSLDLADSISGCSVNYNIRQNNQMR